MCRQLMNPLFLFAKEQSAPKAGLSPKFRKGGFGEIFDFVGFVGHGPDQYFINPQGVNR